MKKEIKANHRFERVEVSRDEALHSAEADASAPSSDGRAEQVQARYPPEHSRRTKRFPLSQRRFHRSLRRAARDAHRQHRRLQAHQRRQRLLQGRRKEPTAPAHLRHRLQEQDRAGGIFRHARGSEEARPPKIGGEIGLFAIDDYVGPGLPLWLPSGAAIIEELEKLAKETEFAAGYRASGRRTSLAKNLPTSGHLPYYADSMFPPMIAASRMQAQTNDCKCQSSAFHRKAATVDAP